MKQLMVFLGFCSAVLGYTIVVNDPLNSLISFILAGAIPGTDIMLGYWPTLIFSAILLLGIRQYVRHIRLRSMEITAKQIRRETMQKTFKESNDSETLNKRRSIIAAKPRSSESNSY